MASPSKTKTLDIQSHIPVEIWDEIILKLYHDDDDDDDQHHIQSLSRVSKFFLSLTNRHKHALKICDPTAHFLPSLFRRFPNLKHLSVSDFDDDPVPVLLRFADFNYPLQSLHLSSPHRLPVSALYRLPFSGLTSLKLSSNSTGELLMIANFFLCLEDLNLSDSFDYEVEEEEEDDDDLQYNDAISVLASKLKRLKRIYLEGNTRISDKGLISLSNNCPNLEAIRIENCSKVTSFGIKSALRACKNLKMFGFLLGNPGVYVDDIGEPLSQSLSLSEIEISNEAQSDELLHTLAKAHLPLLKRFTLGNCEAGFTYAGLSSFLASYNALHHLSVCSADFLSDEAIIGVAKSLKQVRSLDLSDCSNISDSTLHTLIEQCPLLETIDMSHTNIGTNIGNGEERGSQGSNGSINAKIITLNLGCNASLGDGSLEKIALACPNLQTMKLRLCRGISSKGVGQTLRNCPGLKYLDINYCQNISGLDLENTHGLKSLTASSTGLNDDALIDISRKCPDLMFLNVMGCDGLTSNGVGEIVEKCTKLKEIKMFGCHNISQYFIDWMALTRPSLKKIVPPEYDLFTADEENLFMKYGCYVGMKQECYTGF